MNATKIIYLLSEETHNNTKKMIEILRDGEALLLLGITDQEEVECAYDTLINLNRGTA